MDQDHPSNWGKSRRQSSEVRKWIKHHLAILLGGEADRIETHAPFASLGLSSLESITLSRKLGAWLGVEIPATLLWDHPTVEDVVLHVSGRGESDGRAGSETRPAIANEPIACIGMGCRFPGANGPQEFWELLANGRDAIGPVPPDRWDVDAFSSADPSAPGKMVSRFGGFLRDLDKFDADFFRISPREAYELDPRQRLLLETAWEALEDAGIPPSSLEGTQAGVFVATLGANYGATLFTQYLDCVDAYAGTGNGESVTANRLSYFLGTHGPSISLDTACSGSLVAVHLACESLRRGETSRAIAGGVNVILRPDDSVFFSKTGALSPDGRCKTFDERANGIVRSEGVGLVVLERLSDALEQGNEIYCVIRGSAVNHDGTTNGLMSPSSAAQEMLLREAYRRAGVPPAQVQYFEAHGTGTEIGDPIEVNTFGKVLAEGRQADFPCSIGSVKSNIGHCEAAAGIAGLMKVGLSLRHRRLPPNLHYERPNPLINFAELPVTVQTELGSWPDESKPLRAGVSAFGFSGTNAHVVLEEAPNGNGSGGDRAGEPADQLLTLSARSAGALHDLAHAYAERIRRPGNASFAEICKSAALHRDALPRRYAAVCSSREEACRQLEAFGEGRLARGVFASGPADGDRHLAMVFSGQGSHWPGMGAALFGSEPVFRRTLEQCDQFMKDLAGWSLCGLLDGKDDWVRLNETSVAQPLIFAIQVGLAALLRSWGLVPDAVIGQSLGEVAAAHVSGVLTLPEALRVAYHRSRLMQQVAGRGGTAMIGLGEQKVAEALEGLGEGLSFAGSNSPESSIVSGDPVIVDRFVREMTAGDVFARRLQGVDVAFHSAQMDPLVPELVASLHGLSPRPARIPLYTALIGGSVAGTELGPEYWGRNLRQPFLLPRAFAAMRESACDAVVEVSPHPVLVGSLRENVAREQVDALVVPTLRRDSDERVCLMETVGALFGRGFDPDWSAIHHGRARRVSLPTMPWQRQRYWLDQLPSAEKPTGFDPRTGKRLTASGRPVGHPLLGEHVALAARPGEHLWLCRLDLTSPGYLGDHRVGEAVIVPAAAYVEIALSAGKALLGQDSVVIEDLEISRALLLSDDGARQIQVTVSPVADDTYQLQIYSAGRGANEWIEHARARLRSAKGDDPSGERQDLVSIRSRCTEVVATEAHFAMMAAQGIQYGPAFKGLQEIWSGPGEALGRIGPFQVDLERITDYMIHPTVLDAAIQLVRHAYRAASNGPAQPRLPVGAARVLVHRRAPTAGLWCHATPKGDYSAEGRTIEVDLRLFEEDGSPVLQVDSLRLQKVDAVVASAHGLDDCFYQVEWRPSTSRAPLPGTEIVADNASDVEMERKIEAWSKENDLHFYSAMWPVFDRLSAKYVEQAFVSLGWAPLPHSRIDTNELVTELGIAPRHERFLNRLLQILAEEGVLLRRDQRWEVLRPLVPQSSEDLEAELAARFPAAEAELALVQRGGRSLPAVLRGERDALEALLGLDGGRMLQKLYTDSVFMRLYNAAVSQKVVEAVGRNHGRTRILEIGAGTGGTSGPVLGAVGAADVEYVLTDVSSALVHQAEQRFMGDGRVSCRVLDIEASPERQGFEPGHYDVVIAANVIHATRDLNESLHHVRRLLRPGGLLVLLEGEGCQRWLDLIVGGTDGWWRFRDSSVRLDYPLIGRTQWKPLLETAGFDRVNAYTDPTDRPPQFLMVANATVDPSTPEAMAAIPVDAAGEPGKASPKFWVLLADRSGVADDLAARLRRHGEPCLLVRTSTGEGEPGEDELVVDPANYEKVAEVVERSLLSRADHQVALVYLWGLDLPVGDDIDERGLDAIETTCGGFISLVRAAARAGWRAERQLWVVTRGCQTAGGERQALSVSQAPLWGVARTLATEHPDWLGALIDLAPERSERDADLLLAEMRATDGEDQIALRDDRRSVARLTRRTDLPPASLPMKFSGDASYLITGGLSGIGLATAQWMVQRGASHLVLVSRTPLPPRDTWTEHEATDQQSRIAAVRELEQSGAVVTVVAADVGNEAAFADQLQAIEVRDAPPIRGVIHSAGLIDDRLLVNMDMETFARVARPKIRGSWLLHRHFQNRPLDFFVLFSSGTSLVGGTTGQCNYAAGNAFLDTLAHHRKALGLPATSINWGVWASSGIIARSNLKDQLERIGLLGIGTSEGLAALERIVLSGEAQVGAIRLDPVAWVRGFPLSSRSRFYEDVLPAPESNPDPVTSELDALSTMDEESRERTLRAFVTNMVAEVTRLDPNQLQPRRPLNELGLDSILAVEIKQRIEMKLGIAISVVELLQSASLESILEKILREVSGPSVPSEAQATDAAPQEAARPVLHRIEREPDGETVVPASTLQESFWALQQRIPDSPVYNVPFAAHLAQRTDPRVLKRVVDELVRRHETLRTSIQPVSGKVSQILSQRPPEVPVEVVDLSAVAAVDAEAAVDRQLFEWARRPFDLEVPPLMRVALIQLEDRSILFLNFHHAVIDGWSGNTVLQEFGALYDAFSHGVPSTLPEPRFQFADYVHWQQSQLGEGAFDAQIEYWRRQLGDDEGEGLFAHKLAPPWQRGFPGTHRQVVLPRRITLKLDSLSRRAGTTMFTTLLTVLKALLYAHYRRERIAVMAARSDRDLLGTTSSVGCFVNMLALRTRIGPELTFADLLERVQRTTLEGFANGQVPFEHLMRELRMGAKARDAYQVAMALQNAPVSLPAVTRFYQIDNGTAKYALTLNLTRIKDQLEGFLEYDTDRFTSGEAECIRMDLGRVAERVADEPDTTLAEIVELVNAVHTDTSTTTDATRA